MRIREFARDCEAEAGSLGSPGHKGLEKVIAQLR
jgi:hypothetical protein